MNEVQNLIDFIFGKIKKVDDVFGEKANRKYNSLSANAAQGVLQFPMLVSGSININEAQMISRACERNYASFVEIVSSLNPEIIGPDTDPVDYIRQYHKNIDVIESSFNDIDYIAQYALIEGSPTMYRKYRKEIKEALSDFVTEGLNNQYTTNLRRDIVSIYPLKEKNSNSKMSTMTNKKANDFIPRNVLLDNDVKKANELIPTTLHLRIYRRPNENEGEGTFIDFVIGIKVYMHIVESEDMISNIVEACRNKDTLFEFIRWTSGEISFFKDFVFRLDDMKSDIIKVNNGSSPWWSTLKYMARKADSIKGFKLQSSALLPNSTIVLSMNEIEYIKTNYGFDLFNNFGLIKKIMKTYFMLGFVIVDSSSEIAHFLFDKDKTFHTVSFSALERENSNATKQFKEMLKAVQKF